MPDQATTHQLVQELVEAMPWAAALLDEHLAVTVPNSKLQTLVGGDPVGSSLDELLAVADGSVVRTALDPTAARPAVPVVLRRTDGSAVAAQLHLAELEWGSSRAHLLTVEPVEPGGRDGPTHRVRDLAAALRGDEIVLHYQPLVRLADRRPVLVEALARWEHPARGLLGPREFLAAADSAELAGQLTGRVLREACHAAAGWARRAAGKRSLPVTVNLSERQLLQPGTPTLIRDALRVAECPAELLVVEVPERALYRAPGLAGEALRAVKRLGVGIAVDDLGTGSSAFSYLTNFPVDLVKIDRSLVAGIGVDPEQTSVVASLVSLARAMGVRCVAEGVETADQLAVLRLLGCELGQGYLFTRPMTGASVEAWLSRAAVRRPRRGAPAPAVHPEATAVRALALQEQGASLHTIAARLNAEGHRNPSGRRWHHTAVAALIAAQQFPDLPM